MIGLKPILLVEDSANDIELTLAALEDSHVANPVIVLRNGAEALDFLAARDDNTCAKQPVVVLLDIKMPKVSGIEVLRTIKSNPQTAALPVVMLTSSREGPDIDECYRIGANAYVVKPVEFEEFSRAVKDVGRFWAVVNEPPQHTHAATATSAGR
jgi:CheY-like chemotaxis protein